MSASLLAQTPTIYPRVVAAEGLPDPFDPENLAEPVWETWIAAGEDEVIAVYHQEVDAESLGEIRIGYSIYDRGNAAWLEAGIIPGDGVDGIGEPTIAWLGPESGEYLACAGVQRESDGKIAVGVARFSASQWGDWEGLTEFRGSMFSPGCDKPWILAGDDYPNGREIYVTSWAAAAGGLPDRLIYLRSTDSGESWTSGDITLGLGGDFVEAARSC